MKKIVISFILILAVVFSAGAQPHHRPHPRHEDRPFAPAPEVRLHIAGELGIDDPAAIFWHNPPRHYSIGAMAELQVGRRLSLGVGAEYYGTQSRRSNNYLTYYNSVPVYGNIRLSSAGHGAKLFAEVRAGYAIPVNVVGVGSPTTYYETRGLFTGGGIGLSCYGNSISIGVNAIDVANHNGFVLMNGGPGSAHVITDFYLRYSYAIPLN